MSLRPPLRTRHGRRALAAGAFALCVALMPGTAWAEEDPPAPPEAVTDVLEAEQGSEQPQQAEEPEGEPSSEEAPESPPFEIPPEAVEAFQQLAAQAGISEECVTGVADSLELIGNGVASLPAELQQLVTDLGAAVQESIETQDPTVLEDFLSGLAPAPPEEGSEEPPAPPIGGDIAAGLQQLADTLASEACQPAPPSEEPPAQTPQQPPASYQPPQGPAPAPQQAPQPAAQPAVYPGYAPTGAAEAEPGPSPAAVGLALAVLAGCAVWTGRRGAARSD